MSKLIGEKMSNEKSIGNANTDNVVELYSSIFKFTEFTKSRIIELCDRVKPVLPGSDISDKALAEFLHGKQFVLDKTAAKPVNLRVEEDGSKTYTFERITTFEEDMKLYYIKAKDPFTHAFSWNPEPTAVAEDLAEIGRIHTYHSYSFEGFFKPTQYEVISQIPKKLLDTGVVAAYAVHFIGIIGDAHESETVLFTKKEDANKQA